ncbi:MAG TPA: circadian clock KaiB family protein [Oligoflexus sp.]|uniref:circadian clock KaiB family protein n=1 Tax=Oligoflexus sp. TaxID=1971216 RepID=UPI002D7F4209|nr:circadian clock KaiB family protein [Oligoflexus sp.]HET9240348.1 circadian clock KaiB family protein [Oligoflexus sp.]
MSATTSVIADGVPMQYVFCLYVAGLSVRSQRAIEEIKATCESFLKGRYELEIVDIYQQPALAKAAQIVAVPTLVRTLPSPMRRYIGDMSKKQGILISVGMRQQERTWKSPPN